MASVPAIVYSFTRARLVIPASNTRVIPAMAGRFRQTDVCPIQRLKMDGLPMRKATAGFPPSRE